MITVVAALIKNGDKVLIAKRSTGDSNNLGKWEFPGGKVEPNEKEQDALKREIMEEFEMDILVNNFLTNNICVYSNKTIDLRLYNCNYLNGNFKLNDHSEFRWVSIEELLDYDLAEADINLAKFLGE